MEMWEFLSEKNNMHLVIKRFAEAFPMEFEKTSIRPCGHCGGSGLVKNASMACSKCMGVGYKGFDIYLNKSVCPYCNSTGVKFLGMNVLRCDICKGLGVLDWVDAVKYGIKVSTIW